jgi:hypothetical protein
MIAALGDAIGFVIILAARLELT